MNLIHYGNIMSERTEPLIVFELNKDNSAVTVTAPKELLETWEDYFSNPNAGWGQHLENDQPLLSFAGNWSYGKHEGTDDDAAIKKAKKAVLKAGGKEVTVTWEPSD